MPFLNEWSPAAGFIGSLLEKTIFTRTLNLEDEELEKITHKFGEIDKEHMIDSLSRELLPKEMQAKQDEQSPYIELNNKINAISLALTENKLTPRNTAILLQECKALGEKLLNEHPPQNPDAVREAFNKNMDEVIKKGFDVHHQNFAKATLLHRLNQDIELRTAIASHFASPALDSGTSVQSEAQISFKGDINLNDIFKKTSAGTPVMKDGNEYKVSYGGFLGLKNLFQTEGQFMARVESDVTDIALAVKASGSDKIKMNIKCSADNEQKLARTTYLKLLEAGFAPEKITITINNKTYKGAHPSADKDAKGDTVESVFFKEDGADLLASAKQKQKQNITQLEMHEIDRTVVSNAGSTFIAMKNELEALRKAQPAALTQPQTVATQATAAAAESTVNSPRQ